MCIAGQLEIRGAIDAAWQAVVNQPRTEQPGLTL